MSTLQAQTRTLVKETWLEKFGEPRSSDWMKSALDNTGKIITVGNFGNPQNAGSDMLIQKQDAVGQQVWQQTLSPTGGTTENYGTALHVDNSGAVYSAGVTSLNGAAADNDFLVAKHNAAGTQLWTAQLGGSGNDNDTPTSIITDSNGHVYVTGMSVDAATKEDFFLVKLDGGNGAVLWQKRYDYNSETDVPLVLDIDNSGKLTVIGVSAATALKWEIVLLKYDAATGTLGSEVRLDNELLGFDEPSDFAKDAAGNMYITGRTTTDGVNFDMLTVKIDAQLNLIWKKTLDRGNDDRGTGVAVDSQGAVIVAGYTENANGGKEFTTLKYKSDGNLMWQKKRTSAVSTDNASAKDVLIDASDNIIVTGYTHHGAKKTGITIQYSPAAKTMWEMRTDEAAKTEPRNLLLSETGEIYVTGLVTDAANSKEYFTVKFDREERDLTPTYNDDGEAVYVKDEVLIRIEPAALDLSFVDDKGLLYGKASEVISDPAALTAIDNALSANGDFANWTMIKVHPRLTSQLTTTTTRQGKTIAVPDFWGTFILLIPRNYVGYGRTERVAMSLNDASLKDYVRLAELNLITSLDCPDINPPSDTRYNQQGNLHEVTIDGTTYNAHINAEPAWCIETGNDVVKVGFMDSGVRWQHEDFGGENFENNVFDGGYIYTGAGVPPALSDSPTAYANSHGTRVMGIVGAIRDNNLGVSGIAGGTSTAEGVSMWSYQIISSNGGIISDALTGYDEAVNLDAVNIINNSWGFYPDDIPDTATEIIADVQSLREQIHFANRMGVIQIGSLGNDAQEKERYPGTIQEEWMISVGGTDEFENHNSSLNFGNDIDVSAPSVHVLNLSTVSFSDTSYVSIDNTSAATPNVTGLAALLVSHYFDDVLPSDQNLVQEDIEYILERTADDVDETVDNPSSPVGPDYDDYTGHGKINAGAALELVDRKKCNIFHFGKGNNNGYISSSVLEESDVPLTLTERHINDAGQGVPAFDYIAKVYKVTATVQHNLPADFLYEDAWARNSNATVLNYYEVDGTLTPVEKVTITNKTSTEATLEGYIYNVQPFNDNSYSQWLPQPINDVLTDLTYSVLACKLAANVEDEQDEISLSLYPNPAENLLGLAFILENSENVQIEIFNAVGTKFYSEQNFFRADTRSTTAINIASFTNGTYFCRLTTKGFSVTRKFVKL